MKTLTFADGKTKLEYVDAILLDHDHFQNAERRTLTMEFANVESLDRLRKLFADPNMTDSIVLMNDAVPVYDKDGRLVDFKTVKHAYSRFTLYSPPTGTLVESKRNENHAQAHLEERYFIKLGQRDLRDDVAEKADALLALLDFDGSMPVMEFAKVYQKEMLFASERLPDSAAVHCKMLFPKWKSGTSYKKGDRRRHHGILYQCRRAHTATGACPEEQSGYWAIVSDS